MHHILKILRDIHDDALHRTFLRYGKGDYDGPAAEISVTKAGKIKVKSNYQFQDFFGSILLKLAPTEFLKVSGIILGYEPLDDAVHSTGIAVAPFTRKKRTQLYQTSLSGTYAKNHLVSLYEQIGEVAFLFCNLSTEAGWIHKSKTKLPSAQKEIPVEDQLKFSSTRIPAGTKFLEELLPLLVPDFEENIPTSFSSLRLVNTYLIDELVFPENHEQLSSTELRLKTKRKGRLHRALIVDDMDFQQVHPFIA
jgi:hypothetical protein